MCSLPSSAPSPPQQLSQNSYRSSPSHVFDPTPDPFDEVDEGPRVLSQSSVCNPTQVFNPTPDSFDDSSIAQHFEVIGMVDVSECTHESECNDDPMETSPMDERIAPGTPPCASKATPSASWSPHSLFAPALAVAAATPKRQRRTRGGLKCTPQPELLAGKRRVSCVIGSHAPSKQEVAEEGPEEARQRQLEKRYAAVVGVKKRCEYKKLEGLRVRMALGDVDETVVRALTAAPRTPDSMDESLSKRQWESTVQDWGRSLKSWEAMCLPSDAQ